MESSIEASQPDGISKPKPTLAPKPRLTPKPFSLQTNSTFRSIHAPKTVTATSKTTTEQPEKSEAKGVPRLTLPTTAPQRPRQPTTSDSNASSVSVLTEDLPKIIKESKASQHGEDTPDSSVGKSDPAPPTTPPKETPKSKPIQKDDFIHTNHKASTDIVTNTEQKDGKKEADETQTSVVQKPEESGSDVSSAANSTYRWGSTRKRLSMELTSKFESGGLSLPPRPSITISTTSVKEDANKPVSSDPEKNQTKSEPSTRANDDSGLKEDYSGGGSIKRRISLLFDSSTRPEIKTKREEPQVINDTGGIKARIQNWAKETSTDSKTEKKPQVVPRTSSQCSEPATPPAVEKTPRMPPVEPPAAGTSSSQAVDLPLKVSPAEQPTETLTAKSKGALTKDKLSESPRETSKEHTQNKSTEGDVQVHTRIPSVSLTATDEGDSDPSESAQLTPKRDSVKRSPVHFGVVEREDGGPPAILGSESDTSEEEAEEEEEDASEEDISVSVPVYRRVGFFQKRNDDEVRGQEAERMKHLEFEKKRRAEEMEQARLKLEEEREKKEEQEEREKEKARQRKEEERERERLKEEEMERQRKEKWERERLKEEERERERLKEEERERERLKEEEMERQRKEKWERERLEEEERERERLKEEERERERLKEEERERERLKEEERERERLKEEERERERLKEEEMERQRKEKWERERLEEEERERERLKEEERERERLKEEERERERLKEEERERLKEEERERQRKEEERERERLKEEERERERLKEEERERERLEEEERERERLKEEERERERLKEEEMERQRKEEWERERLKEEERERERLKEEEMERERQMELMWQRQREEEREREGQKEERLKQEQEKKEKERLKEEERKEERLREERERQRLREEAERSKHEHEKHRLEGILRQGEMNKEKQREEEWEKQWVRKTERFGGEEEEKDRKEDLELMLQRQKEDRERAREKEEKERLREEAGERERHRKMKEQQEKEAEMERMRQMEVEKQKEEERKEEERKRQMEKERVEELERKMQEELERKQAQELEEKLRTEKETERDRLKNKEGESSEDEAETNLISFDTEDVPPKSQSTHFPLAKSYETTESLIEVVYDDFSVKQPQINVDFEDFSVKPKRWGSQAKVETSLLSHSWAADPVGKEEVKVLVPLDVSLRESKVPTAQLIFMEVEEEEGKIERKTKEDEVEEEDKKETQVNSYCTNSEDKATVALIDIEPDQQNEACGHPADIDSPKSVPDQVPEVSTEAVDTTDFHRVAELAPFPESSTPLLDNSAQRSKADLGKRRIRTRPSRSLRAGSAERNGLDWRSCDSTDGKRPSFKQRESDSEDEHPKPKIVCSPPPTSHRVPMFPGFNPAALIAQIKKRTSGEGTRGEEETEEDKGREEKESQREEEALSPSQPSRSPRSAAHLAGAARVLPPLGGTNGGASSSPAWLKELKSKKRLSQYDSES